MIFKHISNAYQAMQQFDHKDFMKLRSHIKTIHSLKQHTQFSYKIKCSVLDINECKRGIDDCQQICINTIGGFNCECEFGYSLDDVNRKTCDIGIQLNSVKCRRD